MNSVLKPLKKQSEYLMTILFLVAAPFSFLYYIGGIGGDFLPVMGALIEMLLTVGIWSLVPIFLLIKKRCTAKRILCGVAMYWYISTLYSLLGDTDLARGGMGGLWISIGIFAFLNVLVLIAMVVFASIAYVKKRKDLKFVAMILSLVSILFFLVLFGLNTAAYADFGARWNQYLNLIVADLVAPCAMWFAALTFCCDREEFDTVVAPAKKADKEESKPESEKPAGKKSSAKKSEPKEVPAQEAEAAPAAEATQPAEEGTESAEESPATEE